MFVVILKLYPPNKNQKKMKIKLIILVSILPCLFSCQKHEVFKPPNVILIITDDQGYGDLGLHNNPNIKTPSIDAFAKQSIRFNNFHALW